MAVDKLKVHERPGVRAPRLLMGFSGWMDGGDVSTGTVRYLIEKLGAQKFAEIMPEGFYIYNFPGMMEIASLFRPHTRIKKGLVRTLEFPKSEFYCASESNLILFTGREPNLAWEDYADCVFEVCEQFGVQMIYFIGSVSGLVPHTREPHILCTVSEEGLKADFEKYGCRFTEYEGPASLVTYMSTVCGKRGIRMATLVATTPAYVQGPNATCIEAVVRRLAAMLGVHVEVDELRASADEFERRLTEAVQGQQELADIVRKLETDYDNEVFESEMGDLKQWLHQQGIRLD